MCALGFIMRWSTATVLLCSLASSAIATDLKPADITDLKGDGPDGKANTADDTWQFWFELAHAPGRFEPLSLATLSLSAEQRKNGIPRKVTGPIGAHLPNPADSDGWIFHRDWDGRFEGVWADRKTGEILVHPYAEKKSHCAVAISYRVPKGGMYTIEGKLTDVAVNDKAPHDGVLWRVERVDAKDAVMVFEKGGPIGDGQGRPESATFRVANVRLEAGDRIRLVIHPNRWWGADLTRIDRFSVEAAPSH